MINCLDNGKDHRLCEKHWGLVASEDKKTESRARKTVGLSPIEKSPEPINWPKIGDTRTSRQKASFVKEDGGCSCTGCKEIVVITVKGKNLCDKHWDMYRSRKPDRHWRVRELMGLVEEQKERELEPDEPKEVEEAVPEKTTPDETEETKSDDIDDFASRLESGEFDM